MTSPLRVAFAGVFASHPVLMTPHVSGWTEGMMEARASVIAGNIHRVARGEAPVNLVA